MRLGYRLNRETVISPFPCPQCGRGNAMDVFQGGVRWHCCGHTLPLPPLHIGRGWAEECLVCRSFARRAA